MDGSFGRVSRIYVPEVLVEPVSTMSWDYVAVSDRAIFATENWLSFL